MQPLKSTLMAPDWVAIAAHALAHRWGHVSVAQLDETAEELYATGSLRALPPADAVALWLRPTQADPGVLETHSNRRAA